MQSSEHPSSAVSLAAMPSSVEPHDAPRPAGIARQAGGSPLRAYQDFAVGSRSWVALLKYELVIAWGASLPGAAGLAFRGLFWPGMFARAGRGIVWGRNTVVRHPGSMWIGDRVLVDDGCFFDAKGCGAGEFRIDDEVVISRDCVVAGKDGGVHLGRRVNIGAACRLFSDGGIKVGADTMLAANCYVGGGSYDPDEPLDRPLSQRRVSGHPVEIGEDCWLGAGVVVLGGVTIGCGSVIGAGSVVTRDIPPYSIAVGVPAKVTRRRRWAPPAD